MAKCVRHCYRLTVCGCRSLCRECASVSEIGCTCKPKQIEPITEIPKALEAPKAADIDRVRRDSVRLSEVYEEMLKEKEKTINELKTMLVEQGERHINVLNNLQIGAPTPVESTNTLDAKETLKVLDNSTSTKQRIETLKTLINKSKDRKTLKKKSSIS